MRTYSKFVIGLFLLLMTNEVYAKSVGKVAHPVENEYLVMLDDFIGDNVDSLANQLAIAHGGKVICVYRNVIKGDNPATYPYTSAHREPRFLRLSWLELSPVIFNHIHRRPEIKCSLISRANLQAATVLRSRILADSLLLF